MKYSHDIKKAAGFHPLAGTVCREIKEEVETTTATFESMMKRSEDLEAIYEKEDELSEISIALLENKTAW